MKNIRGTVLGTVLAIVIIMVAATTFALGARMDLSAFAGNNPAANQQSFKTYTGGLQEANRACQTTLDPARQFVAEPLQTLWGLRILGNVGDTITRQCRASKARLAMEVPGQFQHSQVAALAGASQRATNRAIEAGQALQQAQEWMDSHPLRLSDLLQDPLDTLARYEEAWHAYKKRIITADLDAAHQFEGITTNISVLGIECATDPGKCP